MALSPTAKGAKALMTGRPLFWRALTAWSRTTLRVACSRRVGWAQLFSRKGAWAAVAADFSAAGAGFGQPGRSQVSRPAVTRRTVTRPRRDIDVLLSGAVRTGATGPVPAIIDERRASG